MNTDITASEKPQLPSNRSKPTIHQRCRQLQHPRLLPFLHHYRRLRRRRLPLRVKAWPTWTVDGDWWLDRADGWVHVRVPELGGSTHGFFP
ncbi:hypothetical protein Patl1_09690 [Pistacia atlantica]|uniref:Uncharacterized protein n=1 Tax=Pistacia atlantica TaxID=434234 RepID=A0ACC1A9L4_9ROSI|nr:hypothetical protein Patl1_09690 [Pistacia atlantica]